MSARVTRCTRPESQADQVGARPAGTQGGPGRSSAFRCSKAKEPAVVEEAAQEDRRGAAGDGA
eukprot:3772493-Lingulodinium_polyedra.AAC.1